MNITILSLRGPTNASLKGGAREYIRNLVSPWAEKGYNIVLICGVEKKYDLPSNEIVDGIQVIRVGDSGRPVAAILNYYKKNLRHKTDILIENMVSFPLMTPLIERKKPVITVIHHLTGWKFFTTHNLITACMGVFLEKIALKIVYRNKPLIAVSDATKEELETNGLNPNQIEIVEPGIDTSYYVPAEKSPTPLIFYIGRMGGVKKVDHLIEAFKKLHQEQNNLELVIAGPGDRELLMKQAEGFPVKFVGFLTDEEKKHYYQKAWLFASPSLMEGFGITYVEANACGTPVVGYEIQGLETVSKEAGIFVKPNDIKGLHNAMSEIIRDEQLRLMMEREGVKSAQRYSWDKSSRKALSYLTKKVLVNK